MLNRTVVRADLGHGSATRAPKRKPLDERLLAKGPRRRAGRRSYDTLKSLGLLIK